jgi:hypothetical protein
MMVTGMIPSTCKLAKLLKSLLMPLAWLKAGNTKWYKHVTLFFLPFRRTNKDLFPSKKNWDHFSIQKEEETQNKLNNLR